VRRRAKLRHAARAGDDERHHATVSAPRVGDARRLAAIAEATGDAALECCEAFALRGRDGRQAVGVVVRAERRDAIAPPRHHPHEEGLYQREREQEGRLDAAAHAWNLSSAVSLCARGGIPGGRRTKTRTTKHRRHRGGGGGVSPARSPWCDATP